MTHEEFEKEYCDFCGTQRCGGVNDKDLDYFYCQECGRKVYYSKNSMFMPHPQLCSFCESHNF